MTKKKKKKDRSNTIVDNSDVLEGFVIKRFDNNDKYEGFYFNGKRSGKGTYIWSNGDRYVGDWAAGVFNGIGTLTLRTGDQLKGSFINGVFNGCGVKTNAKDGSVIEGMFFNGQAHGICKKIHSNGDIFNGFFQHDLMTGFGQYHWNDGSTYIGNWYEDNMNGSGIKTISQDAIKIQVQQGIIDIDIVQVYDGMFSNNLFLGFGTALYSNGTKYSGHWKNSQRNGMGRLEFSALYHYHGMFRNNRYHGRGLLENNDIMGEENDNDIEPETEFSILNTVGVVNYIEKHGGRFVGDFYYGAACGFGILALPSGTWKGVFKDDKLLDTNHPFNEP